MKWNSRWIATDKTTVLFTALESTSNTTGFCKITRKQEKQHINYILKCAHKFERKENKYFCHEKHYWCKIWGSRAAFSFCLTKPCPIAAGNPSQAHSKTSLWQEEFTLSRSFSPLTKGHVVLPAGDSPSVLASDQYSLLSSLPHYLANAAHWRLAENSKQQRCCY